MMRWVAAVVIAVTVVAATGCSKGPSQDEVNAFTEFALERQAGYPVALPASTPQGVLQYVMGGERSLGAEAIVTGSFTGAQKVASSGVTDGSSFDLLADFSARDTVFGSVPATFQVNLGPIQGAYDVGDVARGAGNVVIFVSINPVTGQWVLVDGKYAIALSDKDGYITMPLVPQRLEQDYLGGITDVAGIAALLIAAGLDNSGTLGDIADDGISGTQQDLIDKANDLVNNGG